MKGKLKLVALAVLALLSTINFQLSTTFAQGTAFTYQGLLNSSGSVASGLYDFRFKLYIDPLGNTQVGSTYLTNAIGVTNGLFITTMDFGPGIFTGSNYWLEVDVRTNGIGSYTLLSPFQELTPTPYAIFASGTSNLLGGLPATQLSGTLPSGVFSGVYGNAVNLTNSANIFNGNGSQLIGVNAATLDGFAFASFWRTTGNGGTIPGLNFIGTPDNEALQVKVNNTLALEISPAPSLPNIVGGLAAFRPTVIRTNVSGAVVAGGMAPSAGLNGMGVGDYHAVYDNDGTIGGGYGNKAGSDDGDPTDAAFATVAGGVFNTAGNYAAAVAGGDSNFAQGNRSAILGGYQNVAGATLSMVGGGFQNTIQTNALYSAVVGGQLNSIGDVFDFIGGGTNNTIQTSATYSVIGGGYVNTIETNASYSVIGGGFLNTIQPNVSTATITGGDANTIQPAANQSTIGGGYANAIETEASDSLIAGGQFNTIETGANNSTIGGGLTNTIQTFAGASTVGGGYSNTVQTTAGYSTIGGGGQNTIQTNADKSTIGGGYNNTIQTNANESTIAGGTGNTIQTNAFDSTIGGGTVNTIQAGAFDSTIAGGYNNTVSGDVGTVPGGYFNTATNQAFAAGTQAQAIHTGAFVWGDSTIANIASTNNDSVTMRANGGYRLFSNGGATVGVSLATGSGSWSSISDRNAKENFQSVDAQSVLRAVAAMPLTTWNYKTQDKVIRHLGPMAQDFHAALGVGENDTTISTVDEGGAALAAIQGLNQKLETKDAEIAALKQENKAMEQKLDALQKLVQTALKQP